MRTTVEALEGNKVKLSVNVDDDEFEKALDQAFKRIAQEVRIPGFRPGKAPRRILEARVGVDVARQEALRESLPEFYARAVNESEVDVIAPPEIDITSGEESGPVAFDAVVEVRPKVSVAGYGSLRVTVPSPSASDEEVDAQVDRLRQQFGELQTVDRPARDGDQVSIDIAGSVNGEPVEGLTADDYLYPVGSGAIVPEMDEQLRGAKVGDILTFDARPPGADREDDEDEDENDPISFRILVKDVKEQVLPEINDEWANEASEFETVEELRDDLRNRIESVKRVQAQLALREGVVSALVELVDEDPPQPLVAAELEHRARDLVQRLGAQGASVEQYLQAIGSSGEDLQAELTDAATSAVKADLGLRAVIDAEGIDVDDDEVDAEIERIATRLGEKNPQRFRKQLERADQVQAVRSDLRKGKALEWLVDHAEVVDEEGAPIDRSRLEMPTPNPQEEDA
jgi:trigger factor